jgi:uncharacterized protein YecE (DUF72 family)
MQGWGGPIPVNRELRIGMSGWTYPPWRGTFFPKGLKQDDELAYASRKVNSIEINGTFYSLQRPSSYASWRGRTPSGFLFSVKAPRYITHILRLKKTEVPIANFFASGVLRLNEKLGPLLWQLPPSLPYDPRTLEAFFRLLPRSTKAAAALAKNHDSHTRLGTWLKTDRDRPLRHVLEVRHPSFETPDFVRQLREHDIGLVVADTAGKWPAFTQVTSDLVYVRLHGAERLYVSGYTPAALRSWTRKINAWKRRYDVFVYFDNDVKTRAPYDAMNLACRLGIGPAPSAGPDEASIAEEPRNGWPWRPTKARVRR